MSLSEIKEVANDWLEFLDLIERVNSREAMNLLPKIDYIASTGGLPKETVSDYSQSIFDELKRSGYIDPINPRDGVLSKKFWRIRALSYAMGKSCKKLFGTKYKKYQPEDFFVDFAIFYKEKGGVDFNIENLLKTVPEISTIYQSKLKEFLKSSPSA